MPSKSVLVASRIEVVKGPSRRLATVHRDAAGDDGGSDANEIAVEGNACHVGMCEESFQWCWGIVGVGQD